MREFFRRFARGAAEVVGSPWAFSAALLLVLAWALSGPLFGFSDTWQLVINTGTTVVTFMMVFVIQNTQNRDAKAVHLKLDEVLRVLTGTRPRITDAEDLSDEDLDRLLAQFRELREHYGERAERVEETTGRRRG